MFGSQERYTTVMSADVAGYARLMWDDPTRTVESLLVCQAVIDRLVVQHRGRIVDFTGDNVLAEFPIEASALECACATQCALAHFNRKRPHAEQLRIRIGLHSGCLLTHGDRLFGTTVNLAARLQAAAPIGGVLASQRFVQRAGSLALWTEDGARLFKNIPRALETWRAPATCFELESSARVTGQTPG